MIGLYRLLCRVNLFRDRIETPFGLCRLYIAHTIFRCTINVEHLITFCLLMLPFSVMCVSGFFSYVLSTFRQSFLSCLLMDKPWRVTVKHLSSYTRTRFVLFIERCLFFCFRLWHRGSYSRRVDVRWIVRSWVHFTMQEHAQSHSTHYTPSIHIHSTLLHFPQF